MKNYRPVLLANLQLTLPGLRVRTLRLNQHAPESQQWTEHQHDDFGQILLYLTGRGRQWLGGQAQDCPSGTVVYVPAGVRHAFERARVQPPLVLVLDLELTDRVLLAQCVQLPQADLSAIRSALARLLQHRAIETREGLLRVGATVLEILDPVLRVIGWVRPINRFGSSAQMGLAKGLERLLGRRENENLSLAQLAQRLGYQQDHCNRKLREETGLTLGQWRNRWRLGLAQKALRDGLPVQAAAARIGMDDQNYFSRWFRQQTGLTPSAWKREGEG